MQEAGEISPDEVHLPGVYVNKVILAKDNEKRIERLKLQDSKKAGVVQGGRGRIMRRAAKEFKNGTHFCQLARIQYCIQHEHLQACT